MPHSGTPTCPVLRTGGFVQVSDFVVGWTQIERNKNEQTKWMVKGLLRWSMACM